jgi:hypothetical protein
LFIVGDAPVERPAILDERELFGVEKEEFID